MRRLPQVVLAATMAVIVSSLATVANAAPKSKGPTVTLDGVAVTSQWETAEFSGSASCPAGATNQELVITVTQGDQSGSERAANVVCDGKNHRFTVSVRPDVGVVFEVGNAWVEARLTATDPKSGTTLRPGTDANYVWIRPSGKITPLWPVVLNKNGSMTVTVDAVCRGPWLVNAISAEVRQPGDPLGNIDASGYFSYPDVPCDGQKHRLKLTLAPTGNRPLVAKPSNVRLMIGLEDPVHFDPVDQWRWNGTVTVVRR